MALGFNIGSGAVQVADDIISVAVHTGDSVVVKNVAGDTISYYSTGFNGGATGTVTATNSTTLSVIGTHYLTSAGRSSIQVTGGQYGG